MEGPINWVAISSLATLAAVIVALMPIFSNAIRRRSLAKNLRLQILLNLMLLRPTVSRRLSGTELGPQTSDGFSPDERKPIDTLEQLFSQAHILSSKEHDQLGILLVNLRGLAYLPKIGPNRAGAVSEVRALIERSAKLFEKSKFLQGKRADIPWLESKGGDEPKA